MITILSSLIGFIGAMVPEVLKLFQDHKDKKHELQILKLQIEQQSNGHATRLEEIRVSADVLETSALYKTWHSGISWVDALNGTVRPTIAYAFFALYATTKLMQAELIWCEEDQAIFASVISFYFGQRAVNKSFKR